MQFNRSKLLEELIKYTTFIYSQTPFTFVNCKYLLEISAARSFITKLKQLH
jgi:hypothetical protein